MLNILANERFDRNKLLRIIFFALVFGLVKINSVLAVFILSNFSPSIEIFGTIDYALALGIIICVPLNAGLPGAYPYFILKLKETVYESAFYFHGWILSSVFLAILLSCFFLPIPLSITAQLTILIAAIFCLQILASVMFKSHEKLFTALLFEAGFFLILNSYNLFLFFTNSEVAIAELKNWFIIYLVILNLYFTIHFFYSNKLKWKYYKSIIRFGFPLVTGSLLIIALTGSARIIIERWIDMKAVGIYGLYFRLAALVVLIHQILNIAFFKKIYTSEPQKLDLWFEYFLVFILAVSGLCFIAIPVLVMPFISIIKSTWSTYHSLYFVLIFQMFFWIVLALFENIIYREGLSSKCNPGLIGLFLIMLSGITLYHYIAILDLITLVSFNAITIYLSCEWQIYLLKKANLFFPKTKRLIRLTILLIPTYFIYQSIIS
ncbi:MAG: hypothetical protein AB8F74_09470 [Saprospiraceae bacterium]